MDGQPHLLDYWKSCAEFRCDGVRCGFAVLNEGEEVNIVHEPVPAAPLPGENIPELFLRLRLPYVLILC
jgi:hypothetical protein